MPNVDFPRGRAARLSAAARAAHTRWRSRRRWSRSREASGSTLCTCTTRCRTRPAPTWRSRSSAPRAPRVVTTLHGTDITLVGNDPSYLPITRFSIEQSDARDRAVGLRCAQATRDNFGITAAPSRSSPTSSTPSASRPHGAAAPTVPVVVHSSNFRPLKRVDDVVAHLRARAARRALPPGAARRRARARRASRREVRARGLAADVEFLGERLDVAGGLARRARVPAAERDRELRPGRARGARLRRAGGGVARGRAARGHPRRRGRLPASGGRRRRDGGGGGAHPRRRGAAPPHVARRRAPAPSRASRARRW